MNKKQFLDEIRSKLVGLPDEEIENIKTVGALVAYIEANS